MEAVFEKTTREDQRIAKASIHKLDKTSRTLNRAKRVVKIRVQEGEESVEIPAKAMLMLSAIVNNMAEGRSMALILSDAMLSTQEAAKYLNVSRPHVVKLLERGEIPFTKAGSHRRVKFNDLLTYQEKAKANQKKQLNFLAKQAQGLHLGY